ncbi:MAG: DHA2 family efflux MFS transporter permease subunit [Alphaproteobacteria bacterium]|nr:DHA2 family efflux MFS transporter permease subunit [Alphaproteobacteria bacterium]
MNQEPGATSATWLGFFAMGLGMFMAILDIQVVVTSLPTIQAALDVQKDLISWVQTAYLIAEVIAIPLTGFLTRALTMRGLFVLAIGLFTLASGACAASTSFAMLVTARVVQGFAGGVLIPLVFSAVFLLFPVRQQGIATTIAGVLAVLAPTIGPVVGGWITETFSWPWLFLINIAPGLLALLVAARCLDVERPVLSHLRALDAVSLLFLALGLAALEIGLKEAPARGWMSGLVVGLFAIAALSGASFVKRTLRAAETSGAGKPLVDLTLLKSRDFAIGCLLSFVFGIGLFGSVYLMPVFLGFVRGHGAFGIGQVMLVTGVAQLLAAPLAVQLERRIDARILTACGFALFALGLAMSAVQTRTTDFEDMFWPQVVRGAAIMFCLLPPTRLALGPLPPERVADGSGLFNLMRNLGGAIGLALIDTVIFSRARIHGEALAARLQEGDVEAGRLVGLPDGVMRGEPIGEITASMAAAVRPLLEKAGLVAAINEAWALLATLIALALLALPFVSRRESEVAEPEDEAWRAAG